MLITLDTELSNNFVIHLLSKFNSNLSPIWIHSAVASTQIFIVTFNITRS